MQRTNVRAWQMWGKIIWGGGYDTITKYNYQYHKPLHNVKIREAVNQVILEEQAESNNVIVDTFSLHKIKSKNIINKVENLKKPI